MNKRPVRAVNEVTAHNAALGALRRAWVTYSICVLAIALGARFVDSRVSVGAFCALHVGWLALVVLLPVDRRTSRLAWTLVVLIGLPGAFSAAGLVLPALHPQPFEWRCIAFDRWLFGTDPTVVLQARLSPVLVEVLQWAYASFYFLPIALLVTLLGQRRWREYDATLCAVAVGFLLSYLAYYLVPTLPPYLYLDHGGELVGMGAAEKVRALLDRLEANRFDCMPSGHTMLTLMTLWLARCQTPRLALALVPIGIALIVATVALRYHYVVDVVAGALLAPLALSVARWLLADPQAEKGVPCEA